MVEGKTRKTEGRCINLGLAIKTNAHSYIYLVDFGRISEFGGLAAFGISAERRTRLHPFGLAVLVQGGGARSRRLRRGCACGGEDDDAKVRQRSEQQTLSHSHTLPSRSEERS